MPSLNAILPHRLGQAEACRRMQSLLKGIQTEYRDQVHNVVGLHTATHYQIAFSTYGFDFVWTANVHADRIELRGEVPAEALKYRTKIEETIIGKVGEVMGLHHPLARAA